MMRVDGKTIILTQANSGSVTFRLFDPDRYPFDVAGYTLTFMVKDSKKDADTDALITKVVTDVQGPLVTFTLLPDDTNIPVATYWWGLQLKRGDYVNQCASGPFYVTDGVIDGWQ